jgi:hypothetical protein
MTSDGSQSVTQPLEEQIMGAFIYNKYINSIKQNDHDAAIPSAPVRATPRKDNYIEDDDPVDLAEDEYDDVLLDDLDEEADEDDLDSDDDDLEDVDEAWLDDDMDADWDDLADEEE